MTRSDRSRKRHIILGALAALSLLAASGGAQAQSDGFYAGKTVRIIVGASPGGFYDRWARLLARYLPLHIPGNPSFIVQNMPSASSVVAANYVSLAKRDPRLAEVPTLFELLDQYKAPAVMSNLARVVLASGELGRPMMAAPGVAPERIKILRAAYAQALRDPGLIDEAKKSQMDLAYSSGEALQAQVKEIIGQPREVIELVKKVLAD